MVVATETVTVRFEDIAAGTPLAVSFPCYEATDVRVYYGKDALLAVYVTDYTVTLGEDYDTFSVTPTASLISKINALIAADATEENYVTIKREMDFTTEATSAGVRNTPFTSREFDRTVLRDQQINDVVARSVKLSEKFEPPYVDLRITEVPDDTSGEPVMVFNAQGGLGYGPTSGDIEDAQTNAAAAAASATAAALYDGPWLDDVAALLADTSLTYTAGQPGTVVSGDYVRTRTGFAYRVAASGASDHHLATAGGVKVYVQPSAADGSYSVHAFGVVADYVPGSSTGTDQSTAIQLALDTAYANKVAIVRIGAGFYRAGGVTVPSGVSFLSDAAPASYSYARTGSQLPDSLVTILVGVGTGPKSYSFSGTDVPGGGYEYGGEITNPSSAESYTATHGSGSDAYRIADFTNGDASGTTKATAKTFSAILRVLRGSYVKGIGVTNNASGTFGWCTTATDFGDEWDVGIWCDGAERSLMEDCMGFGLFRIAGWLETHVNTSIAEKYGGTDVPQSDHGARLRCTMGGHAGLMIRGQVRYPVTASTSNSVTITWSASHPWPTSGEFRDTGTEFDYTGLTYNSGAGTLTFTGVTPDASGVSGEIYSTNTNYGLAQLAYYDCYILDIPHSSNRYCVDDYFGTDAFDYQSASMEISGRDVRQPMFYNCTWHAKEDRAWHIHDLRHMMVFGGHVEGRLSRNESGTALTRATRLIGLGQDSGRHTATDVYRSAREVWCWGVHIDFCNSYPAWGADSNATTKYGFGNALWEPVGAWSDMHYFGLKSGDDAGTTGDWVLNWLPKVDMTDYDGIDAYVATVFNGTADDADNMPPGSIVVVFVGSQNNSRNSTRTIYIDGSDSTQYTIFDGGSYTSLDGTWRNRGQIEVDGSLDYALYQRVS